MARFLFYNPSAYIKEFCYLSQAYDLTWHDYYISQVSVLTPEEQNRIQVAARQYADQNHLADSMVPVGEVTVLATEPHRDYQPGQSGQERWDIMIRCLLQGMIWSLKK